MTGLWVIDKVSFCGENGAVCVFAVVWQAICCGSGPEVLLEAVLR